MLGSSEEGDRWLMMRYREPDAGHRVDQKAQEQQVS